MLLLVSLDIPRGCDLSRGGIECIGWMKKTRTDSFEKTVKLQGSEALKKSNESGTRKPHCQP